MPSRDGPVWTTGRKLMGNLLPMVVGAACAVVVYGLYAPRDPQSILDVRPAIMWALAAFVVAGWLATNWLGLVGNRAMRGALAARLQGRVVEAGSAFFVGFSRPTYGSVLDPHEDVGFLVFHDDRLEFAGDRRTVSLARGEIERVRYRASTHTWAGLGRWVSVEGVVEGKPVRMLVEPRERATLLGNLLYSKELRSRIEGWLHEKGPQAEA